MSVDVAIQGKSEHTAENTAKAGFRGVQLVEACTELITFPVL